jgi:hypothetical protein
LLDEEVERIRKDVNNIELSKADQKDLLHAWVAEKGAKLRNGYRSAADLAEAKEYFDKMAWKNQMILD